MEAGRTCSKTEITDGVRDCKRSGGISHCRWRRYGNGLKSIPAKTTHRESLERPFYSIVNTKRIVIVMMVMVVVVVVMMVMIFFYIIQ